MRINKIVFTIFVFFYSIISSHASSEMKAHYIDVGQGNAVLLEFDCGVILLDVGAQDVTHKNKLLGYLLHFFSTRPDLNKTIDLLAVTHPHADHNDVLQDIAQKYSIKKYIDDGWQEGSGGQKQIWMENYCELHHIPYTNYSFEEIKEDNNTKGIHDTMVDPIRCETNDPLITIYSGRFDNQPEDWSKGDYDNLNNHSLVIKVVFGKASFLFTGDLEKKAINTLTEWYAGTASLHADILMIGHHGANNAISDPFLDEVSPEYAVISCGHWNYGTKPGENKIFNTYKYGHPRVSTLQMLNNHLTLTRRQITVEAAEGSSSFRKMKVTKSIYATPWDDNIIITATDQGTYTILTHQ